MQTNWRAVMIAYGVGVLGAVQVGRVAPAMSALRAEVPLDLATLGWTVSLITLASALLGLAAGYLVLGLGARRIMAAGTMVLAAAVLAAAFAGTATSLLAVRAVEGVGYLAIVVAAPTLIARETSARDRSPALALWGTFFTLGLSIAAIAGGAFSELLGWRGWYAVNAGLLAFAAPIVWLSLPKDRIERRSEARLSAATRLPAAAWLLAVGFFGLTLLSLALLSMLPVFLIEVHGVSPASAGRITGLTALSSLFGSFAYGALANRLGQIPVVFTAAAVLLVAAFPAFGTTVSPALNIVCTVICVIGTGVLIAHVFASVPRLIADLGQLGPANGLVAQIGSIGALTGPPAVGYLIAANGWGALSLLVAGFTLAFMGFILVAERVALRVRAT